MVFLLLFINYLLGTWNKTDNTTCAYCNDALNNCIACEIGSSCLTCQEYYYLYEEQENIFVCVDECPPGC